jgi:probable phosphoglycerate mutase
MRHGESEANVLGVAVGDPRRGIEEFGLTDRGRRQAAESAVIFKQSHSPIVDRIEIIASDFRRTRETAELLAQGLGNDGTIMLSSGLRERSFGELEGQDYRTMTALLETEGRDALVSRYGCEPPEVVQNRVVEAIRDLEEQQQNRTLILVSHGDPIQLLMTAFAGLDASEHERIITLDYAEIAELSADTVLRFKRGIEL